MFKEYTDYDALGLAELVKAKQVSPKELLDTAIARAELHNPALNAITQPLYDYAYNQLEHLNPKGRFYGVPFLLKDLLADLKGFPTQSGTRALAKLNATQDANIVKVFKQAGLQIMGKTNTPELGLMGITEPKATGPTRNPWNLSYSPGGSSGGSAAAVAARIVPMASAGDGGGSIRIPAACCGLFGLKPSRGLTPTGPVITEPWQGAAIEHVVSMSVRDSAAMLELLTNNRENYLQLMHSEPGPLRIALCTESPLNTPVSEENLQACRAMAHHLESLGHSCDPQPFPIDGQALAHSYMTLYMGQVAADVKDICQRTGLRVSQLGLEPSTLALANLGQQLSSADYVYQHRCWAGFAQQMSALFKQYDVLLTPCIACPVPKIGEIYPSKTQEMGLKLITLPGISRIALKLGAIDTFSRQALNAMPFTQLANLTGLPAMSVPAGYSPHGLPLGCQFVAPLYQDTRLLSLARQIELSQPWAQLRPEGMS